MSDSNRDTDDGSTTDAPVPDESLSTSRRRILQAGLGAAAVAMGGAATGLVGVGSAADIETPRLRRDGNLLVDPDGNTVTLRGVNIADPKRLNLTAPARGMNAVQVIDMLTDTSNGWYPRAIRVPVQPVDIGEYEPGSGPPVPAFDQSQLESYLTDHLDEVVQRCAERNVYCIIDYHRHRDVQWAEGQQGPVNTELQDEVDMFWDTVAQRYAEDDHVIYEVYNEPTEPGMWQDPTTTDWVADVWQLWLEMAQPWVDTIRSHADNLILMGSPSWTQSPEGALVEEFDGDDIAYTYHIYPGHNSSRNNDWEDATRNGEGVAGVYEQAPLVVTEFGWEQNAGQYIGGTTSDYGEPIIDWMESHDAISWTAWVADPVWRPVMFERGFADESAEDSIGDPYNGDVPEVCPDRPCQWDLLGGEAHMGDTIKQTLADHRNDNVPGTASGSGGSDWEDSTPPTAPGNLSVAETGTSSVEVTWSASSDDGTGVDGYTVYVDGSEAQTEAADATSATIVGLSADTSYEIGVAAVDGAGNESNTATVSVTTDNWSSDGGGNESGGDSGSGSGGDTGSGSGGDTGSGSGGDTGSGSGGDTGSGSDSGNGSDDGSDWWSSDDGDDSGWWGSSDDGSGWWGSSDDGSGWW